MASILHYLTIIFVTGLFSLLYFFMLKLGMDNVVRKTLEKEKVDMSGFYSSLLLRIILAGVFFFFMLKYYRKIDEIVLIILTFIFVRYLAIGKERKKGK